MYGTRSTRFGAGKAFSTDAMDTQPIEASTTPAVRSEAILPSPYQLRSNRRPTAKELERRAASQATAPRTASTATGALQDPVYQVIKPIKHAPDYRETPVCHQIAKFWDSLDETSYQNIWHEKIRDTWLEKNGKAKFLMPPYQQVFLAKDKKTNAIVGMAWYENCSIALPAGLKKDEVVEIYTVVHPGYQGKNIGKVLMEERLRHIQQVSEEEGIKYILSQVFDRNPHLERLKKAGWREVSYNQDKKLHQMMYPLAPEDMAAIEKAAASSVPARRSARLAKSTDIEMN